MSCVSCVAWLLVQIIHNYSYTIIHQLFFSEKENSPNFWNIIYFSIRYWKKKLQKFVITKMKIRNITEKYFLNLVKSTKIRLFIVFTIFRSIWNQTEFRLVLNQSKKRNYNQNLDWFNQIQNWFFCVDISVIFLFVTLNFILLFFFRHLLLNVFILMY